MLNTINTLIVDDHKLFREGIKELLYKSETIQIVDEAENGEEAIEKVQGQLIDVVLMDINMPVMRGVEATEKIVSLFPEIKILVLTMYDEEEYIINMLNAGALGYIIKDTRREELITAIRTVAMGDSYFEKSIFKKLVQRVKIKKKPSPYSNHGPISHLTKRELAVLTLLARGYDKHEIAKEFYISWRTVDTHRGNLLQKLNAKNTIDLVKKAIQYGLAD